MILSFTDELQKKCLRIKIIFSYSSINIKLNTFISVPIESREIHYYAA